MSDIDDSKNSAAAGGAPGKEGDDGQQQDGNGEPVIFTEEQKTHVQKLIQTRLKGANKKIVDLEARLAAMEGAMTAPKKKDELPAKKTDDPLLAGLQSEIAALKAENAATKAEAEAAKIDKLKIKMAKGKFPAWFDPTLLPGKTEEEIETAIENILAEMKAEAEGDATQRKKQGFGGPLPKGKGVKPTGNEIMNDLFLGALGRSRAR